MGEGLGVFVMWSMTIVDYGLRFVSHRMQWETTRQLSCQWELWERERELWELRLRVNGHGMRDSDEMC